MKYAGIVQKGGGYGRTLGFPTANIPVATDASGIFAARITCEGKEHSAAVYSDTKRNLFEAHLLDFDGDLYGKEIEIELLEKIRDDMRFADEDEARNVIGEDVANVRAYFNR